MYVELSHGNQKLSKVFLLDQGEGFPLHCDPSLKEGKCVCKGVETQVPKRGQAAVTSLQGVMLHKHLVPHHLIFQEISKICIFEAVS